MFCLINLKMVRHNIKQRSDVLNNSYLELMNFNFRSKKDIYYNGDVYISG